MSDLIFPVDLAGLQVTIERVPEYSTQIRSSASGLEARTPWFTQARSRYRLSFEVLRSSAALAEWQALVGFYQRHGGRWDSFLFQDPNDCECPVASPMPFGIGDGSTTEFQLQRTLVPPSERADPPVLWPEIGGGFEPVQELERTVAYLVTDAADYLVTDSGDFLVAQTLEDIFVYADGVELDPETDFTVDFRGLVVLTVAPAPGVVLSWAGRYYWRVRFATDALTSQRIVPGLWQIPTLELQQVT